MNSICLAMIVKNESKVIERCLRAARPFIDTFCIFDTGSEDGTIEKIIDVALTLEIKGFVGKSEWKDYGTNRTEVFDCIKDNNLAEYALVLDADDVIVGKKPNIIGNVGEITIKSEGIEYLQRRLFDMKMEWEYRGKLHEAPYAKRDELVISEVIKETTIIHMHDGGSWENEKKKYDEHVSVALSQDLSDPRNQFYLAQSLRAAQRFNDAIIEYRKRIEMVGGWYQEAVYSQLMIARIEHSMGEVDRATLDYLQCYEMDPERGEALVELVVLAKNANKFNLGLTFSKVLFKVIADGQKPDKLFSEPMVFGPAILLDIGLCAYYSKESDKKLAKKVWTKAIRMKNVPDNIKDALKKNLEWVK